MPTAVRRYLQSAPGLPIFPRVEIILAFLFGIANFAMHKAVMRSGHRLVADMPWLQSERARRITFVTEFGMLLGTLLLVANGYPGMIYAYAFYSALNLVGAWLILGRRV